MDFLVMDVQHNAIVKLKFVKRPQESVYRTDVRKDGWEQLAVKVL